MARPRHDPKLFTLEEANRLIPEVVRLLKRLRKEKDRVLKLEKKKAVEELCGLQQDGTVSAHAQEWAEQIGQVLDDATLAFEEALEEMNGLGAQMKDLDEGLVDFFAERDGEIVYLCWKDGEDAIRYWHGLDSGFAGRKPIDRP